MARDPLAPQPPPNPKRSDSKEIVESIIEAAIELAGPDVTTNAIAERAGVGIASLYRYFPNRSAIFAEISRRFHKQFLDGLDVVLESSGADIDETIEAVSALIITGLGLDDRVRRCLNLYVPLSWTLEIADHSFSIALDKVVAWLEARLTAPPSDLRARAFCAFAASRGVVLMALLHPSEAPTPENIIAHMVRGTSGYLALSELNGTSD